MEIIDKITGQDNSRDTHKVAPIPERLRKHQKILILTADGTEDTEFFYPYYRLTEEGYDVDVATPNGGAFTGKNGMGLKDSLPIGKLDSSQYELIYIPGGKAPQVLREQPEAVKLVIDFAASGKPIASICHGAQLLIAAGLVSGKRISCWPDMRDELEEAGGVFVDEALVEDGQFITGRMPGDLHRHLWGVLDILGDKGHLKQVA